MGRSVDANQISSNQSSKTEEKHLYLRIVVFVFEVIFPFYEEHERYVMFVVCRRADLLFEFCAVFRSESSRSSSRSSFSSRSRQSRSRSKGRSSDSRSHSSSRSTSEVQTRKKPMQFKLSPSSRPQIPPVKKSTFLGRVSLVFWFVCVDLEWKVLYMTDVT